MSTIKPTSVPSKRLSETINGSASSFKLNNIEGWDGADLTSADFGTVAYAVFRNSAGTLMEIMEIDPSTIASASITINKRGLKFTGDLATEVAANKLTWIRGDTIVELGSHPPQLFNSYVDLYNEQTITGAKSFPTPTASGHAATKGYVDSLALGGTTTVDKVVVAGNAGEAVTIGQLVYLKSADGEWYLTDADTASTVENVQLGIAQGAGTDGNTISGGVLLHGLDTNQSGLIAGTIYYASNTAGAISSTTGTTERIIGVARNTTNLYFDPVFYYSPTAIQKAAFPSTSEKSALAGSQGVVGSANKYITQDSVFVDGVDQSQETQNATVEVAEANATTKKNKLAQSFIPAFTKVSGVKLYKSADTGTFTGTVTISIQADSAGSPSGSALVTLTLTNAQYLAIAVGEFEALFASEYSSLVVGSLYWIVIECSTADNSNHPNLGTNSAGGYGSGSAKYNNSTDAWVAISTIDLYFKTLEGVIGQIPTRNGKLVQVFDVKGTWTWYKPSNAELVEVICIGAGGGGASGGIDVPFATGASGGSGGGGGAITRLTLRAAELSSTETVTVGAGGAGGAAASGSADSNGNSGTAGGSSSFGSHLIAYGGGAGFRGDNASSSTTSGGGGGGVGGVGADGSGADNLGGSPATTAGANGISGQGAGGDKGAAGTNAEYGGGAGGGCASGQIAGGSSLFAAGGGGSGGSSGQAGGAGGKYRSYTAGGGGAGGAAGVTGTAGASTVGFGCGSGGGGGGGLEDAGATAGSGAAGGSPGGGGGGGGGNARTGTATSGAGGAGGNGRVIVIVYV